jgi:hypothetical protein
MKVSRPECGVCKGKPERGSSTRIDWRGCCSSKNRDTKVRSRRVQSLVTRADGPRRTPMRSITGESMNSSRRSPLTHEQPIPTLRYFINQCFRLPKPVSTTMSSSLNTKHYITNIETGNIDRCCLT